MGLTSLLLLVDFKSVLAFSTFVTVRMWRYSSVFPHVAFGAHFAALKIAQVTFTPWAELHVRLRT